MTPLVVVGLGLAAIAAGTLLLRTYGPRARVGRLLAVTPRVSIAVARDPADAGRERYLRVEGRLDADGEFPDEGSSRPLVLRRARLEARVGGHWRTLSDGRRSVPAARASPRGQHAGRPEPMRIIGGGDHRPAPVAAAALFAGLALMAAGFGWALVAGGL